jgi:hypothetical protein
MPAYELREHRRDHGYNVLGTYATVNGAWAEKERLIAEDAQRRGRYTIEYVQGAEPDVPNMPPPATPVDVPVHVAAEAHADPPPPVAEVVPAKSGARR